MSNGGLYKKLNLDFLSDWNTYTQLSQDPTMLFQKKLKSVLQEGVIMGAITQKLADKQFVIDPVVPIFHSLPKIHKYVFPPPVRPIVAGIGSLGERLGNWIDSHLHIAVVKLADFLARFSNYAPAVKDFLVVATQFLLSHNYF